MNRAERIYKLHGLLKSGQLHSLERLMGELEISRATLVRDFGYMRDFMNAPILYDVHRNGYRYDETSGEYELPGLWFNHSELHALLATGQLLELVQPGLLAPYIGPLKARVRRLLEQSGHAADTLTGRVLLQPAVRRPVNAERFGEIAGALLDGKVIAIDYHGRERDETSHRRVHPQRLLHYRDNWYLAAWCEQAQDLRTFSLDRILRSETLAEPARMQDDDNLQRYLGAAFGIFTGVARGWAVLRFSPRAAHWVADEIWHPDQIGHWAEGGYQLQIPYADPRELLMDILKYGPEVEVLAPAELRSEVADRLRRALACYED